MRNSSKIPFSLGVAILAAGRSSRMGRPKLLLPWGETSVIGHLIRQWEELGAAQIAVVCAVADQPLFQELDRLCFPAENRICNAAADAGMFSSVQCAARFQKWSGDLTHWAIVLGDQPHLRPDTLRGLLEFAAARPRVISQPGRGGHGRHPVILPHGVFARLARSTDTTLKDFLAAGRDEVALFETDDGGFDLDVDHPADYEQALRMRTS